MWECMHVSVHMHGHGLTRSHANAHGGAVCGDGTKDAGEECDDGNKGHGDGCSETCTVESGYACVDNAQKQSICNLTSGGGKGGKTRGTGGGGNSRTRAIRSTSTLPAPESADGYSRSLCGHSLSESPPNSNKAAYGPCIATLYHHLELSGSSSSGDPAFAGMDMTMVALKKDLYGQVLCGK
jgi:cysteine-rich repeat protein